MGNRVFPQEGKYHYDGHRACKVCWKPEETIAAEASVPYAGQDYSGVLPG